MIQRKIELYGAVRAVGIALAVTVLCAACEQTRPPRSFNEFMDDAIARDGALARCNQDKDAALHDIECTNARRAAAAAAVAGERARSGELERESERKLAARRERDAAQQQAELDAVAEARAAAERAYEAQWRDPNAPLQPADAPVSGATTRAFGPPFGAPVRSDSGTFALDVYADSDGGQRSDRPSLELAAVTPPPSDLDFARPDIELEEAVIPRPFRSSTAGSEPVSR